MANYVVLMKMTPEGAKNLNLLPLQLLQLLLPRGKDVEPVRGVNPYHRPLALSFSCRR